MSLAPHECKNILNKLENSIQLIAELRHIVQANHQDDLFREETLVKSREYIADLQDIVKHYKRQLKLEVDIKKVYGNFHKGDR